MFFFFFGGGGNGRRCGCIHKRYRTKIERMNERERRIKVESKGSVVNRNRSSRTRSSLYRKKDNPPPQKKEKKKRGKNKQADHDHQIKRTHDSCNQADLRQVILYSRMIIFFSCWEQSRRDRKTRRQQAKVVHEK